MFEDYILHYLREDSRCVVGNSSGGRGLANPQAALVLRPLGRDVIRQACYPPAKGRRHFFQLSYYAKMIRIAIYDSSYGLFVDYRWSTGERGALMAIRCMGRLLWASKNALPYSCAP
jgi:hypothetical protein